MFYPIYSPSSFHIHLEFFDADGLSLVTVRNWKEVRPGQDGVFSANVEQVVDALPDVDQELLKQIQGIKIAMEWGPGAKIPTRLKFGLNVGVRGREVDLPTNICFNSKPANPGLLKNRRRSVDAHSQSC